MDTTSSLDHLLVYQNQLLSEILEELRTERQPLGFGPSPRPVFIYCNRTRDCLWYTLSEDSSRTIQPIQADALTGIITQIETVEVTRRGKATEKLHVHVKADRRYVLESGIDSNFSRALLHPLSLIPVEKLKLPITIAVEPGESEEVLFCRIYNPVTGEAAFAPWDASTNWAQVLERAIAKVEAAHGSPQVAA